MRQRIRENTKLLCCITRLQGVIILLNNIARESYHNVFLSFLALTHKSIHILSSLFVPTVCILPHLLVWHITLIIIGVLALMVAVVMTIWMMITYWKSGGKSHWVPFMNKLKAK